MNRTRLVLLAITLAAAMPLTGQRDPQSQPAPAPKPRPLPLIDDFDFQFDFDDTQFAKLDGLQDRISSKVAEAMSKIDSMRDLDYKMAQTLPRLDDLDMKLQAVEKANIFKYDSDFAANISAKVNAAMSKGSTLMAPQAIFHGRTTDHERSYENGIRAIDGRHYERALEAFSQVAMTTGVRTDGALYWKAYALNRLGRRDEALAALAELRRSHAASRWSGDAKSLEAEIKQNAGGQTSGAQMDADEDLKALALSGLMHSDPDKAVSRIEQIVKGSSSRKLQEQALQTLANSESQKGRDLLAQIARGKLGNPDLQLRAIRRLANRRTNNRELLREIFSSATDEQVKRAALRALGSADDQEQLLRIGRSDKDPSIRMEALAMLGNSASSADLWALYQAETSVEVKERILHSLKELSATDRLLEVAKSEKEPKLRQYAIRALGSLTTGDALVSMHISESDQSVKRTIVDALYSHKNGKALVELAHKEKDPQMRREIVSRLSRMDSKEASDFLVEILK